MNITVLIADDHAVVRDGLRFMLAAQPDIDVIGISADGHDAIRQAEELKPDVVIMDINMPLLNGIEATHQIREVSPSSQVIILSMYATNEHIFRALQAGVCGYLLKETAGVEVVDAVRIVHTGRRYLSEKISEKMIDDYLRLREDVGARSPLEHLSNREREVLQLVVEGKTSAEIAEVLFLSPKTVDTYRSRLMQKLGVHDLTELVKFAIQHGLTPLE